ncbi:hypothetical protein ILYODFUR_021462 [Ilyodon furcidens]|uniref:Uncharacterized protein n=1 Tax=Ilyodon furcidens TaxID=33524 RepID=A0ABV0UIA7_9TELE
MDFSNAALDVTDIDNITNNSNSKFFIILSVLHLNRFHGNLAQGSQHPDSLLLPAERILSSHCEDQLQLLR